MADQEVRDIFEQIKALSPADRLRLAADLLDAGKPKIAKTLIERVDVELGAALLLAEPPASVSNVR